MRCDYLCLLLSDYEYLIMNFSAVEWEGPSGVHQQVIHHSQLPGHQTQGPAQGLVATATDTALKHGWNETVSHHRGPSLITQKNCPPCIHLAAIGMWISSHQFSVQSCHSSPCIISLVSSGKMVCCVCASTLTYLESIAMWKVGHDNEDIQKRLKLQTYQTIVAQHLLHQHESKNCFKSNLSFIATTIYKLINRRKELLQLGKYSLLEVFLVGLTKHETL